MKILVLSLGFSFIVSALIAQATFATIPLADDSNTSNIEFSVGQANKTRKLSYAKVRDSLAIGVYPNRVSGLVDANNAVGFRRKLVRETSGRLSYVDAMGTRLTIDSTANGGSGSSGSGGFIDPLSFNRANFTQQLQAAIDSANGRGGGTVKVSARVAPYELVSSGANPMYNLWNYSIRLKSNVRIVIESGATIQLANGQQTGQTRHCDLFVGQELENCTIEGGGTIRQNTSGQAGWTGVVGAVNGYSQGAGGSLIRVFSRPTISQKRSKNIVIRDLRLVDAFANPVYIDDVSNQVKLENLFIDGVGEGFSVTESEMVDVTGVITCDSNSTMNGDVGEIVNCRSVTVSNCHFNLTTNNGNSGSIIDFGGSQYVTVSNVVARGWFSNLFSFSDAGLIDHAPKKIVVTNCVSDTKRGNAQHISITSGLYNLANLDGELILVSGNVFTGGEIGVNIYGERNILHTEISNNKFLKLGYGAGGTALFAQTGNTTIFKNNSLDSVQNWVAFSVPDTLRQDPFLVVEGNTAINTNRSISFNALSIIKRVRGSFSYNTVRNTVYPIFYYFERMTCLANNISPAKNTNYPFGATEIVVDGGYDWNRIENQYQNQTVTIKFNLPNGAFSRIRDKRDGYPSGNILLKDAQNASFSGQDIIVLQHDSILNVWKEQYRSTTDPIGYTRQILTGWSASVVSGMSVQTMLCFGSSGHLITRPCYVRKITGKSLTAVTQGTVGLRYTVNGNGYNITYLNTTNPTVTIYNEERVLQIPANSTIGIAIDTSSNLLPANLGIVSGSIEIEY